MRSLTTAVLLLTMLSLQAAPAAAADRTAGLRALVGVWQLDSRVSEDPRQMLRQVRGRAPGPDRTRGGGRGGRRDGEDTPPLARMEERLTEFTQGEEVLTVACVEPELTITYWDDHERVLKVDGKKVEQERAGGSVRVKASWKGSDRLVVTTDGAPEGRVLEIFELGSRGDKLFVTVELYSKGSKAPFSFQRLYNRLAGDG